MGIFLRPSVLGFIMTKSIANSSSDRTSQCSRVVRNCCKGDVASQWEIAIFGHLGLWKPRTDRVEISHDWLRPPQDTPRHFGGNQLSKGDGANTPLVPLLSFLLPVVTFFVSIRKPTADTAEPILTRDSSYDVYEL